MAFVNLTTQSGFSFHWGTFLPEELVAQAKAQGQKAVALTDKNGLYGIVRLVKAARRAGLKPVIGAEIDLNDASSITLLVKDEKGYRNLCQLLSLAHEKNRKAPQVSLKDLARFSQGLICLLDRYSKVKQFLSYRKMIEAESLLERFLTIFPKERLFLTLENNFLPEDAFVIKETKKIARKHLIPLLATNKVVFLAKEDFEVHKTLVGVAQVFHHQKIFPLPNASFHFLTAEEAASRIPIPGAIENTYRLLETITFSLELGKLKPPRLYDEKNAYERLVRLLLKTLARLKKPLPPIYLKRLEKELQVIRERKLADFFLLIKKVRDEAKKRNIRCTVRGSAAGSLIVYLLLGGVDPVAERLLFERFLNEGRADLPDVDLDFDSDRRDEILSWLLSHFSTQAAMVSTIHTFRVRGAVRMLGRALGYSYEELARLSAGLPSALRRVDLLSALDRFPELENHPILQEETLLRLVTKVAGLPYQASVHLGGVVITPSPIREISPVIPSAKGFPVIQFDKDDIEALGLLKFDLLGLRMHTAIRKSLEALSVQGINIELDKIPLDDQKTYHLLQQGDTLGVFQLESPGQRQLVKRLKPRCFSDIVAEVSLFRPGPVEGDMVNPFVRRRNGLAKVLYPHPDLAFILKETYGVILFQEQVLEIAHHFSGMSYAEADAFRRAMTKDRSPEEMASLKERFLAGARKKGYSVSVAERVFEMVASFAAYGFCKAHAASFAHITYQSAYLKAHYPREFYLGLLNAGHVGSYPRFVLLNEARRKGIPIYPPHVNASGLEYLPEKEGIRVPLWEIKLVGRKIVRKILAERESRGPYHSVEDFQQRVEISHRVFKMMDAAGAFLGLYETEKAA